MDRVWRLIPFVVLLALGGCGTVNVPSSGSANGSPVSNPSGSSIPATSFYVGSNGFSSSTGVEQAQILQFSCTATGNAAPLATLNLPAGFDISYLATDKAGQIYVGGTLSSGTVWQVLVFPAGAVGSAAPLHTLQGNAASFGDVLGMTVDSTGQLYILDSNLGGRVLVMAPGADGAAVPLRVIAGSATRLSVPDYAMAVDGAGNLYVANNAANGAVLVFGPAASGNVAPIRIITDSVVMKSGQFGLDVDTAGNLYVSSDLQVPGVTTYSTISVFAPGANGVATPVRTIAVDGGNPHLFASSLRVDSATGTIYLSADDGNVLQPVVFSYGSATSGTAAPATRMNSGAWKGPGYVGIALR
jgi:hypothetical protein